VGAVNCRRCKYRGGKVEERRRKSIGERRKKEKKSKRECREK
jgi:hypothetical protein